VTKIPASFNTERPSRPDDLKEIPGLSEKFEQALNAAGVWRFAQIARWAPVNVDTFAVRLQIPTDRIYRERWVSKARALASLRAAGDTVSPMVGRRAVAQEPAVPLSSHGNGEPCPSCG